MRAIPVMTLVFGLVANTAPAGAGLRDVQIVEDGLFAISVAEKIRRECGEISGRVIKARGQLRGLYQHALGLGYSEAQIEAYVNDADEKKRMKAKRDAYLSAQGVVKTDPATYCAAGRAEMQRGSPIGALLR